MLKFSANLGMLFGEVDFLDRFAAARHAGFSGVEYPFPYTYEAERLRDRLAAHGLEQVLINLPPGNWDLGERGIACQPDRKGEFQDGVAHHGPQSRPEIQSQCTENGTTPGVH